MREQVKTTSNTLILRQIFTGSTESYKFHKYLKHTSLPTSKSEFVSVFNALDYDTYKSYIIDTYNSGSVEIDNQRRINIIWFANKPTGQIYQPGHLPQPTDGVKLVLHSDDNKIHAYPTGSQGFSTAICEKCRNQISI